MISENGKSFRKIGLILILRFNNFTVGIGGAFKKVHGLFRDRVKIPRGKVWKFHSIFYFIWKVLKEVKETIRSSVNDMPDFC